MSKLFFGNLLASKQAIAVIMAGGSGTRFWPLSRTMRPKQFLALGGSSESLIQATASRLEPLSGAAGTLVVTAEHQAGLVLEQLPQVAVLAEPQARNTAPCIGFAALKVLETVGDVPMVCVPADHMIWKEHELLKLYEQGIKLAQAEDVLVTVGIKPTAPETGYGYIRRGAALPPPKAGGQMGFYQVAQFVEKPNRETAEEYLRSGEYFWNSGMFIWRPSVILREIGKHVPELAQGLERIKTAWAANAQPEAAFEAVKPIYASLPSVSIDVGVMEKASNVVMLPGDSFDWSDVGSWSAWAEEANEREGQNGNFMKGDVVLLGSTGCSILGNSAAQKGTQTNNHKSKLIAGVGLKDLIVVETDDAILICHRDHTQDVKKVVDTLREQNRDELL